jgi:glycosyltransferase involved in cell wall biosynthesis
MRKLRVGVWVPEGYRPDHGGGFSYLNRLINGLYNFNFKNAEITFFSKKFPQEWAKFDKSYQIETNEFTKPINGYFLNKWYKVLTKLHLQTRRYDYYFEKLEVKKNIEIELSEIFDIIYYPTPDAAIMNLDIPFIYTLWDIGHKTSFSFPELNMNGNYEARETHHSVFPQKAIAVFCESESGKIDALKYLNISEDRLKVVNLFSSELVVKDTQSSRPAQMQDGAEFIHYPAQFWPHKNHYHLILAFKKVLNYKPKLKLILTGSEKGNLQYIMQLIRDLELTDSVLNLGFVKSGQLKWLYENSKGLVMPTLLGPTNMPLLEAAELGCKVACSNCPGHIEQLGDYAFYFDPLNVEDITTKILQMLENYKVKYEPKFTFENTLKQIDLAFTEISKTRFCWG